MGTWSHEPFGNDTACDWAYGLEGQSDFSLVAETIQTVLDSGTDYLCADVVCEAIAAIEVLAKACGRGTQLDAYTEPVDAWLKSIPEKPSQVLLAKGSAALTQILGSNSELRDLWEINDDFEKWEASIKALQLAIRT